MSAPAKNTLTTAQKIGLCQEMCHHLAQRPKGPEVSRQQHAQLIASALSVSGIEASWEIVQAFHDKPGASLLLSVIVIDGQKIGRSGSIELETILREDAIEKEMSLYPLVEYALEHPPSHLFGEIFQRLASCRGLSCSSQKRCKIEFRRVLTVHRWTRAQGKIVSIVPHGPSTVAETRGPWQSLLPSIA